MDTWFSEAPEPDHRREQDIRRRKGPLDAREAEVEDPELVRLERDAQEACDRAVKESLEAVSRAKEAAAAQDKAELNEQKAAFRRGISAWETPGPSEPDAASSFAERAKRCARRDANEHMARRRERADSLKKAGRRAYEALDAQRRSRLDGVPSMEDPERLRKCRTKVEDIFEEGRAKISRGVSDVSHGETIGDPFHRLNSQYQDVAEEERRSRQDAETATTERRDTVLGLFEQFARDILGNRGPQPPSDAPQEKETPPGLVERTKTAVAFRMMTYAMDGVAPGSGALARHLKLFWETGEALTGDGPVRITVPLEGTGVGVTLTNAGRRPRLRFDPAFGDQPTIGPEAAPGTRPADRRSSADARESEPAPADFRRGRDSDSMAPRSPTAFGPRDDAADPRVGAVALSVKTGRWRVTAEPGWWRPAGLENNGPREFAELDTAEFLLVTVYGDMRGLHGRDLAVHGLILAQRALHQRVFDPRRPESAKTSAQWLRRIGAVILCDRGLGLAAYIDVDPRTREPSCEAIAVLSADVAPPPA
ncbi:hypothetical protein [Actinomadura sp. GTD37]|uniref:hypothetical protein n=1 Tax=Actinomadura sp. GTD37 TaxID=1778030 RepID=UPI0035C0C45C